jgi:peptide/nickel transport system permease protein
MLKYALHRLAEMVPTTLAILLVTFFLFTSVGDSPALIVLGKNASVESIERYNALHGYDRPLVWARDSQLVRYFGQLARGDFGESVEHQRPVLEVLKDGVGPSLAITIPVLALGSLASLALALVCAYYRSRWPDMGILFSTTFLLAVNAVLWVLLGQFFLAYKLGWFPIWGFDSWRALVLPVLLGTLIGLPRDVRFLRTLLLDEIYKPYLRTARAKGLPTLRILLGHLLPNTMIPIVTYFSLSLPFLFTGSLLLESTFGIPGLGAATLNALHSADLPVIRAVVLLGALAFQLVNLLTDLSYALIDPRVRLS